MIGRTMEEMVGDPQAAGPARPGDVSEVADVAPVRGTVPGVLGQ